MMSPELHQRFTGYRSINGLQGGQELLLSEIMALLDECKRIWIPFYSSGTLIDCLIENGYCPVFDEHNHLLECPEQVDALYFGTPTIVDGKPLFYDPQTVGWGKQKERKIARELVNAAIRGGCKRIITGLGTGDVSIEERLEDMGGGQVVCFKMFNQFSDWLLVRDLR